MSVLAYGFRPFFLVGPVAAIAAVLPLPAIWLGLGAGWEDLTPGQWHGHEQVFGFFGAALAGFVLTALPSWTGTPPVIGRRLAALVVLWAIGRLGFWLDGWIPASLVAALDIPFLLALVIATLPAMRKRERRPWEFPAGVALVAAANVAFHLGRLGILDVEPQQAIVFALDMFLVLIAVSLGRILPVVTRFALKETGQLAVVRMAPGRRHLASATLLLFAVAEVVAPESPVSGWIALAAACAQLDRMGECHLGAALLRPQVALFYLTQGWIALGLALLGMAMLGADLQAEVVRHALALGGAGTAVMTVQSIVSLRHTGRDFPLPYTVWVAPALIAGAAILRIVVPHMVPEATAMWSVTVPAILWVVGFAVWLKVFGPWLVAPRPDGKPG